MGWLVRCDVSLPLRWSAVRDSLVADTSHATRTCVTAFLVAVGLLSSVSGDRNIYNDGDTVVLDGDFRVDGVLSGVTMAELTERFAVLEEQMVVKDARISTLEAAVEELTSNLTAISEGYTQAPLEALTCGVFKERDDACGRRDIISGNVVFDADMITAFSNGIYADVGVIFGGIYIQSLGITDLSFLRNVRYIGGYLIIRDNTLLESLSGLDSLTSIGARLEIDNNDALISLSGLNSVTAIGESVDVRNNAALLSLSGLDSVTSIGDFLLVFSNDDLVTLNGLDGVVSVGGNLHIYSNGALASLDALSSVGSVGGEVYVRDNAVNSPPSNVCEATQDPRDGC